MKKRIPIGISDFKRIIEEKYHYVDKSMLIEEIINDGSTIILLLRPCRFGKTLNMYMLKYLVGIAFLGKQIKVLQGE
jgi:hypothetical protein